MAQSRTGKSKPEANKQEKQNFKDRRLNGRNGCLEWKADGDPNEGLQLMAVVVDEMKLFDETQSSG